MSPPLETHEQKIEKSFEEQNDQAMDLFLSQMAEYNHHSQQTSLDQASTSSIHPSSLIQDNKDIEVVEFAKPSTPARKGKQKQKDNSHSSLLQVFTNPLLHAIPILARNFSNFEDFLAQTSMPGQSLLGPGELEDDTNYAPMPSPIMKHDSPWHIRVLGLPHTGAKSRVETQIKICLQLADTQGELATHWSHIKLPEHLIAKDKLKRKNQKYGDEKASLIDNQILSLEVMVVCDSHPDNEIIMCPSCVHRERKRLKRKRDNKVVRAANKEGSAAKLAALFANELPDLSNESVMAEERKRILLFNCNEYVEFNNGEATLPTRVTCYCRHHSEKTGFRIVFTLKDHLDQVIGTGRSPPIMITDDHKSSKLQQQTAARKRARADMDASATESDVPSSKRKTVEIETDSGVSSPVASTPATPSSPIEQEEIPNETPLFQQQQQQQQQDMVHSHYIPPHPSSFVPQQQQQQTDVFDFLNSHDMMNTQPVLNQFNPMNNLLFNTNQHGRRPEDYSLYNQQQQQQSQQQSQQHIYAKLQERNVEGSKTNVPRLHRLIPSEGPVYGGAEVTVLGSNFYEGLTCLFGENPAIPTHCWSANTLLCILPPATSAGPVVVSFKEHPLMLEGQDVVLFTYFDESDRALMELALQVVGLKTMGKVEDARQIAMRIVQGDNHPKDTYATHTKKMTTMEANAVYDNARTLFLSGLEHHITQSLLALEFIPTPFCIDLSLTNRHQHSLLHLATLCGHVTLVKTLIQLDCNVNQMDKNGFTALHFASWSGQAEIVQLLIDKTNLSIVNRGGKTAERLAIEAGHHHVISLFQKRHKQAPVNVRIPLTDFIPPLTDVLPTRLLGFLSHLYRTTSCAQRVVHSAGQLYHFMLDPF